MISSALAVSQSDSRLLDERNETHNDPEQIVLRSATRAPGGELLELSPMMAGGYPNMAFPAIAEGVFVMSIGRRSEFRIRVNETMTKKNVAEVLVDVLVQAGVSPVYR